jgi:peptide deformylase
MFATSFLADVLAELRATMRELKEKPPPGFEGYSPAGLAAPQIGVSLRIFLLALYPHPFINPTVEYVLGKPVFAEESCYSTPGYRTVVARAAKIRLRARLEDGTPRSYKMRDRDARAAQHENDHLDGLTIYQRSEVSAPIQLVETAR